MFNAVLYCGEIETKKGQTITSCSSIDVLNLTKCCFDVMEPICLMEQDFDTPDVRSSLSNFDPTKEKNLLCKHAHKRDFFKSEGKITRSYSYPGDQILREKLELIFQSLFDILLRN